MTPRPSHPGDEFALGVLVAFLVIGLLLLLI